MASYDTEVLADSPNGYWILDETSGTTAEDSSGNNRDLTKNSGVSVNAATVQPAGLRAYDFSGINTTNNLTTADASWESPHAGSSGAMTLECWVELDSMASIATLFRKGATNQFEYSLDVLTTGSIVFSLFGLTGSANTTATTGTGVITVATPHHIVAVYDQTNDFAKIYVDTVEEATTTTGADTSNGTAVFDFGMRRSGSDRFFDGQADHLALYPTALSSARVTAHYNAGQLLTGTMAGAFGGLAGAMSGTELIEATADGPFGALVGTMVGSTVAPDLGTMVGTFGSLTGSITGSTPFDADSVTADLLVSPWRADLVADPIDSGAPVDAPLGVLTGTMTGTVI